MGSLNALDMVRNATTKQYKEIATLSNVDIDMFVESSVARGGCFWSAKYQIPIPGVLNHGNCIETKDFINRLKEMKR